MTERKYLPTFADLIDRLSIVQLKAIFITENTDAYNKEMELIMHDIDLILSSTEKITLPTMGGDITFPATEGGAFHQKVNAKMIRAIMVVMLTNRFIWENETKARQGGTEQDKLLKLTHSINGVRNTAKNIISNEMGERVDLKVDCLASELIKEFGNWQLFTDKK